MSEESQKLPQENLGSEDSSEIKEISLILRHTELDSEDYIAITIKSKTESIDELILKAKNAFPKNMKKNQNLMDPIN